MCGIAGKVYFDPERKVGEDELKRMTGTLIHRGPDDEGFYIDQNVGLGFRRLSIIDLNSGHQPLSNYDGSIWITFNGEIYNFQELKSELILKGYKFRSTSDTEVIVHLYEEYKEDCIQYLRGMFAFVIWDSNKKQLFGARDRFGIKPFFYYLSNTEFIWASEIKAITNSENIDKNIDLSVLDYYLAYGYSPGKQSIFSNIKKLEPATFFTLKPLENHDIKYYKYWDIEFTPDTSISESEWQEMIYDEFKRSVELRMISDVPLGAFLSGGLDSSSVVAMMSRLSNVPVKTFSIGFKEAKYNELNYARLLADKFKTEHHEMILEPQSIDLLPELVYSYDEPFADNSAIPTYYVSKFAREYVTVALSGDGGDELFAGYDTYKRMLVFKNNILNNNISNKYIFRVINAMLPDYMFGKGYSYYLSINKNHIGAYFCLWRNYERYKLLHPDVTSQLKTHNPENSQISILSGLKGDYLSKMQGLDLKTYLSDDILTKVDRVSMSNSLEVRVPILDHKLAELSFRIPSSLKLNKNKQKYIFKKAMKSDLPDEIISHKNQGFAIPLEYWFRDNLKEYAYSALIGSSNLGQYLNIKYVRTILDNHQKNMRDYSQRIWSLLFLNEWLNQNN